MKKQAKKVRKLSSGKHLEAQKPLSRPALSDIHITKPTDVSST
jgi:hypothetical protein